MHSIEISDADEEPENLATISTNKNELSSINSKLDSVVACPLCTRHYPISTISYHANSCAENQQLLNDEQTAQYYQQNPTPNSNNNNSNKI